MAREHRTGRGESGTREVEVDGATADGADAFSDAGPVPGVGPEIKATRQAMGASNVDGMNAVNGNGARYDVDHGVKYDYNYERELQMAGRAGEWKDDYRQGHTFAPHFRNPSETGSYMRWELKPGHSASEGIQAWLAGVTVAECLTAVLAINMNTLRKAVGDDKFDARFGAKDARVDKGVKQRLVIHQGVEETPLEGMMASTEIAEKAAGGDAVTDAQMDKLLVPGDWYYFYNHPKYLLKHPGGAWQGENSLYMGRNAAGERMWSGMGATDKTESAMVDEMVGAYNAPRDDADEREMLDRKIINKEGKFGFIHKRYDPANGMFPDEVTAKDILEAPAYKIDGTTRKGGFMFDSGTALVPDKVQALRDG